MIKLIVEGDELCSELARKPQIGGVIGGEPRCQRDLDDGSMLDGDLFDNEPLAQRESGEKLLAPTRMPPAFGDADIGDLESEEAWRNEPSPFDAPRHRLALRLAK